MFEYHFHGLNDGHGTFVHTGTTHDFLEVCCQIAQLYNPEIAGKFVDELMTGKENELSFLRVTNWNFEYYFTNTSAEIHAQDGYPEGRITLNKTI